MVKSFLPILDSESDGYASSHSCASMAKVYMVAPATPGVGGVATGGKNGALMNIVLHTPITGDSDTEKALEESRQALQAKDACLARQRAEFKPRERELDETMAYEMCQTHRRGTESLAESSSPLYPSGFDG